MFAIIGARAKRARKRGKKTEELAAASAVG